MCRRNIQEANEQLTSCQNDQGYPSGFAGEAMLQRKYTTYYEDGYVHNHLYNGDYAVCVESHDVGQKIVLTPKGVDVGLVLVEDGR